MKQLCIFIFFFVLIKSGSHSQQSTITCRMDWYEPTVIPRIVDKLVLRDTQLAFRFLKELAQVEAKDIFSCKAALRVFENVALKNSNSVLGRILRYCTKVLSQEFWYRVIARGYDITVPFQDNDPEQILVMKSKVLLRNSTLFVAARENKPSLYITWANDRKTLLDVGGTHFYLFVELQKYLRYNFRFKPVFEGITFRNGTWNGIVKMLINKEIDLSIQPLVADWDRSQVVDFTHFIAGSPFTLMIPYPQESRSLLASTWPFTLTVWLCTLGTVLILTVVLTILVLPLQKTQSTKAVLADCFLFLYGVICCQGMDCPGGSNFKIRSITGLWCLAAIVFVYTYNSQLTSYLTVPQLKPLINSIHDLAGTDQLHPLTMVGNTILTDILNAKSGTYKLIGDRVRQNYNMSIANTFDEAMQKMVTGKYAFAVSAYTGGHYGDLLFRQTRRCSVLFTKEHINYVYSHWYMQKNSPYLPAFNDKIKRVVDHGLMTYLMRHSNKGLPRFQDFCKVPIKDISTTVVLNLGQLQSAFAVLGIGLTAALIAFLVELYSGFRNVRPWN